ncbi:hypothetical protein RvY_16206 [Ramazzottius varieornatus]|uniref:Uncharacterized protein n=1 Tax=Ramazzottius varieornatus TaxID=947166 RepID=A0A1D1W5C4_RAMVA|nr:hypothetical protein RvY_16206 [Ramazzottius varieornatus]
MANRYAVAQLPNSHDEKQDGPQMGYRHPIECFGEGNKCQTRAFFRYHINSHIHLTSQVSQHGKHGHSGDNTGGGVCHRHNHCISENSNK